MKKAQDCFLPVDTHLCMYLHIRNHTHTDHQTEEMPLWNRSTHQSESNRATFWYQMVKYAQRRRCRTVNSKINQTFFSRLGSRLWVVRRLLHRAGPRKVHIRSIYRCGNERDLGCGGWLRRVI